MSQQTMSDERVREIGDAIIAVLDQLEAHEREVHEIRTRQPASFKTYSLDQWSIAVERGDFFLEDPVGYGLRAAVRKAGKVAAKNCPDQLHAIADYAAKRAGEWSQWRSVIIDKNFDGLTSPSGEILWIA